MSSTHIVRNRLSMDDLEPRVQVHFLCQFTSWTVARGGLDPAMCVRVCLYVLSSQQILTSLFSSFRVAYTYIYIGRLTLTPGLVTRTDRVKFKSTKETTFFFLQFVSLIFAIEVPAIPPFPSPMIPSSEFFLPYSSEFIVFHPPHAWYHTRKHSRSCDCMRRDSNSSVLSVRRFSRFKQLNHRGNRQ